MKPALHRWSCRRGIALIVVLMLVALLAFAIVSFFLLVGQDRRRARSFLELMKSRMMLESATQEVMAKIMDGSEVPWRNGKALASMTAAPGLIEVRYYDRDPNRGDQMGAAAFDDTNAFFRKPFAAEYSGRPANPVWIPLFSQRLFAPGIRYLKIANASVDTSKGNPDYNPAVVFNINTTQNPFSPGKLYLTGTPQSSVALKYTLYPPGVALPSDAGALAEKDKEDRFRFRMGELSIDRPVYVQWLPIYENPREGPRYTDTNGGARTNRIVGRYAYWVDVENTKVNINVADRLYDENELRAIQGESDAVKGGGRYFAQRISGSPDPPWTVLRRQIEGKNMTTSSNYSVTQDGASGTGDNTAAVTYRDLMLGWRNGERPLLADNSTVDWRTFTGIRPDAGGLGTNTSIEDLFGSYAEEIARTGEGRLNTWSEAYSLLDPQAELSDVEKGRVTLDTMQRTYSMSTTIYGHDDERDPLGRPKIDLVKFLTNGMGSAEWTDLKQRLSDPDYHRAYYPNAYPRGGQARSLADAFSGFAGDLSGKSADGEAAVDQMLVNILEYAKPFTSPPYMDKARGIVGAKSMPYVAEVATRARSALWLPEMDAYRTNVAALAATNATGLSWTNPSNGRPISYYLTNVIVDVALGMVNPNLFATNNFTGEVELDYDWSGVTATDQGGKTTNFSGVYAARPIPAGTSFTGRKKVGLRANGTNLYFNLGVVPGETIGTNSPLSPATPLKIKGWNIKGSGGALFDEVPLRHPGQSSAPREWWAMAQDSANPGSRHRNKSTGTSPLQFQHYQSFQDYYTNGRIAVGWFTPRTIAEFTGTVTNVNTNTQPATTNVVSYRIGQNHTFIAPSELTSTNTNRVTELIESALMQPALVERAQAIDPTVGHRTGNPDIPDSKRLGVTPGGVTGHFYGAAGHPWRRYDYFAPAGTNAPGFQTVVTTNYGPSTTTNRVVTVQVPVGNTFATVTITNRIEVPGPPVGRTTNVTYVGGANGMSPPSALTSPFQLPGATNFEQAPMNGSHLIETRLGSRNGAGEDIKEPYGDIEWPNGFINPKTSNVRASSRWTSEYWDGAQINKTASPSLINSAPSGSLMVSVGELGFVHSGFMQRPINLSGDATSDLPEALDAPVNGPPMRMLMDLFTPGAFRDNATGIVGDKSKWENSGRGGNPSNSPTNPRRGTWNINVGIASDSYMAIREGGGALGTSSVNPSAMAARVTWAPTGIGFARTPKAAESQLVENNIILDPFLSPFPRHRRGWEGWVSLVGGDYTTYRSLGSGIWDGSGTWVTGAGGTGKPTGLLMIGQPMFTWCTGRGVADPSREFYETALADFDPEFGGYARLLTFGMDGRGDKTAYGNWAKPSGGGSYADALNDGFLKGLFAADQFLPLGTGSMNAATRFNIFPMRQFNSEVLLDVTGNGWKLATFGTPLNPQQATFPQTMDRTAGNHPGDLHESGIYRNAGAVAVANQVTTSANVFKIHIVAQSIKDIGKERPDKGSPAVNTKTGVGYIDADDVVVSEQWAQAVVARVEDSSGATDPDTGGPSHDYRTLSYEVRAKPQ